ncbi:replicative DNA helicase [Neptuniibacter sp. QD37_11]|uniref:replicative DNA helicase n=1 Tax=Neptuniibacter sp. QD37_11 TaxID=3398209 RepID=UPI0039F51696
MAIQTTEHMPFEQQVLGVCLNHPYRFAQISSFINAGDFTSIEHRAIHDILADAHANKAEFTLSLLVDRLHGTVAPDYISWLYNNFTIDEDVECLARDLRGYRNKRDILNAASEVQKRVNRATADELINLPSESLKVFDAVRLSNEIHSGSVKNATQSVDRYLTKFSEKKHSGGRGLQLGIPEFDDKTLGLHSTDLIIVGARPSMGKTVFGLQCVLPALKFTTGKIIIASLEMPVEQLIERLICCIAKIDYSKLREGKLTSGDAASFRQAGEWLSSFGDRLLIEDCEEKGYLEYRDFETWVRSEASKGEISLVLVDYLQLFRRTGIPGDTDSAKLGNISMGLKALAKLTNAPVVSLAQLNRSLEQRVDKRPIMSDLRESGNIEQDADVILFLYRDTVYNPDTEFPELAEIIIGKQRAGQKGTIKTAFKGHHMHFAPWIENGNLTMTECPPLNTYQ